MSTMTSVDRVISRGSVGIKNCIKTSEILLCSSNVILHLFIRVYTHALGVFDFLRLL